MFQYRQILVRVRQGDTDRENARSGLMGRRKVATFGFVCQQHGWLDPGAALPEDATLAAALGQAKRARSTISSAEQHRELIPDGLSKVSTELRSMRHCVVSAVTVQVIPRSIDSFSLWGIESRMRRCRCTSHQQKPPR